MEMQAPKGTKDMLPQDAYKWHFVEKTFRDVAKYYGMREIRTPMFEHTELFARGVGDTTDIVQKEMYTFNDKGNRSITLKPEGTAGAGRAFIESRLFNEAMGDAKEQARLCLEEFAQGEAKMLASWFSALLLDHR